MLVLLEQGLLLSCAMQAVPGGPSVFKPCDVFKPPQVCRLLEHTVRRRACRLPSMLPIRQGSRAVAQQAAMARLCMRDFMLYKT